MYILDTDIISNLIKPKPSQYLISRLKAIPSSELFISVITLMELYTGFFLSKNPEPIKEFIEEWVIKTLNVLDFTTAQSFLAAKIQADLKKKGEILDWLDIMIASTVIISDGILITGNLKHFKRIQGLRVENWLNY